MKIKALSTFVILACLIVSCSSDEPEVKPTVKQEVAAAYKATPEQLAIDKRMDAIDNDSLLQFGSLLYYKGEADVEVAVFRESLESDSKKLIETFTPESGIATQRIIYYLEEGKKFATHEVVVEGEGDNAKFVERVSYFNNKEEVLMTKERKATYEEDLETTAYLVGNKSNPDMSRALRVLDQSGEFAPYFKSFINGEDGLYMIVGEDKADGFSSTLLVNSLDGLVGKIYKNPSAYKGKLLGLTFTKESLDYFEFQLLHSAALIE